MVQGAYIVGAAELDDPALPMLLLANHLVDLVVEVAYLVFSE